MTVSITCTNKTILVSNIDRDLQSEKWLVNNRGYVVGSPDGRYPFQRQHRIIMARVLGRELTRQELVDHINLDPLDNRRDNLRLATNSENLFNRGIPAHNTTGYKGVYRNSAACKQPFQAAITFNYRKFYLGSYDTAEDAARAYNRAARDLAGEFARGNQL